MKTVIDYISKLKGKEPNEVLSILRDDLNLSSADKNLIYLYLFPRPLLDKELPFRIMGIREDPKGKAEVNQNEVALILEAGRTEQYGRFIKHLFYSFKDSNNIFPIKGSNIGNCCLCGKDVYEETLWRSFSNQYGEEEITNKLFQAYGSIETDLPICLPCLLNLRQAIWLMEEIDPYFLIKSRP